MREPHEGPLRDPSFRAFLTGEVVSTAGSSMAPVALAFAVLHLTGSATALGWVVASWTGPMIALMLVGGALADRLPRRFVLQGAMLVQAVAQAGTGVLVLTGDAPTAALCTLQLVAGSAAAVSYPALHGMVPTLLAPGDRKAGFLVLAQARGLLHVLGPALAGALVAVWHPGWALVIDALTYAAAAALLARVQVPARDPSTTSSGVVTELRDGLREAHALGWVLPGAVISLGYNAAISGGIGVLGPAIAARTSIGADGWGLARSAEAAGLVLGAVALRRVTLHRPLVACHTGFLVSAVPMLVLATSAGPVPVIVAMAVAGGGAGLNELAWNLTVAEHVPDRMLSRIMSVDGFFSCLALPVGQLAVGPAASAVGPRAVEAGCAGLVVLGFVAAVAVRPLRLLTLASGAVGDDETPAAAGDVPGA